MRKRVAVVILNWNGRCLLEDFLPSVCTFTPDNMAEIVVVDNGSTDDSVAVLADKFPTVRAICLSQNYGFAEGYNRGLEQIDTEYVVLLNSDVQVTDGWLDPLLSYCDIHRDVAACQPKIKSFRDKSYFEYAGASGGFIDKYGYAFCRGRVFDHVEEDRGQYDSVCDIFWATGACLFIRLDAYRSAGGLDARFFAHMEEIDLCWRVHLSGKRIVVIPQSTVYHLGAATLSVSNPRKTFLNFRNNLLMIYKNVPLKAGKRLLFIRRLLDTVALCKFLLTGEWGNANAVWKSHQAFRKDRKIYHCQPEINLLGTFPETGRNILFDYFIKGKKTF